MANSLERLTSATLPLAAGASTTQVRASRLGPVGVLLAPVVLLLLGSVIGLLGTLDTRVAQERIVGLVLAAVFSVLALAVLARGGSGSGSRRKPLAAMALVSLVGGLWVISASGPDVFRGPVGFVLNFVFRPLYGLVNVTDPVAIGNTRFIVGYNGLADLCLVAIFTAGAAWLERRRTTLAIVVGIAVVLLVGTGARGGLTGLAAGMCAIGLFAWPRRYALLVLVLAPLAAALLMVGVLDKGLEFSSTTGRWAYWTDLSRLLVEYPLTGVGLGVDTVNKVALAHEINPDPERIFYAHNTFVQAALEQGPLGVLGELLPPIIVLAAIALARRHDVLGDRRSVFIAGLGIVGGMEAHGLTDQVVTTTVGTALVLLGLAMVLVALPTVAQATLSNWLGRGVLALLVVALVGGLAVPVLPSSRALVLLDVGGLQLNRATLALDPQTPERAAALAEAETTLRQALAQAPDDAAVMRDLARVRAARYDDAGALAALQQASKQPRLDAFDMLQIAHVYRDLGDSAEAYSWAAQAYAAWGRPPEDAVMQVYAQNTLLDHRAQTLASQAEAAMRARSFAEALSLFQQAQVFAPDNRYVADRIGAAARAVAKYGPGQPTVVE